jgi:uncharacterized protein YndB with AHSA1/START domain
VFEATETAKLAAPASAVWPLWADPSRWPEWNPQAQRAEVPGGELVEGGEVRVKLRRGGTVRHTVIEVEPQVALATEVRFPGARVLHEHRVSDAHRGSEVTHRISVSGPLWALWAPMLGRRRMRESLAGYLERERELLG